MMQIWQCFNCFQLVSRPVWCTIAMFQKNYLNWAYYHWWYWHSKLIYVILAHWSRVTHIYVSKLTITGSDNGLLPGQCQAFIWTNAEILLIWSIETKFSDILIKIHTYSFKKIQLKMSSGKFRPFCLSLNVWMILALCPWSTSHSLKKWLLYICINKQVELKSVLHHMKKMELICFHIVLEIL